MRGRTSPVFTNLLRGQANRHVFKHLPPTDLFSHIYGDFRKNSFVLSYLASMRFFLRLKDFSGSVSKNVPKFAIIESSALPAAPLW